MILVIVRRYNDIDHTTPLVYKLACEHPQESIVVLAIKPQLDLNNDFRLRFLKHFENITLDYAHHFLSLNFLERILFRLIRWSGKYSSRLIDYYKAKNLFGLSWARKAFRHFQPNIIICDYQNPRTFSMIELLAAAKELKIPIISVPHGLNLIASDITRWDHKEAGDDQDYGYVWRHFDHVLIPFSRFKKRIASKNVPEAKIQVLGSARFCAEWRDIYETIVPTYPKDLPARSSKLNIVIMDHSAQYRLFPELILETINSLRKLDFVNVLIKPSTAGIGDRSTNKVGTISSKQLLDLDIIAPDHIQSFELIQWADAVLCTTSSIAVEVLLQNKILIHPKYFHENTPIYEEMNCCWQINSYQELEAALVKLNRDRNYQPYPQVAVQNFVTEIVNADQVNRDVLGGYVAAIMDIMKGEEK